MRSALACLTLTASFVALAGCAELRQNLRGQELSYRGAWFCEAASCSEGQLVKSREGTREGTTDIATVKIAGKVALAFTAASAFDRLEASVRDCKGKSATVAADAIVPAGKHEVGDSSARESWIIWLDRAELRGLELGAGKCSRWLIDAKATWTDGATYSSTVGIEVAR